MSDTARTIKAKRTKGDGSLLQRGRIWWIYYKHPDGRRIAESAKTERRAVALRLLRKRIGAGENNLPVIPKAEQLTFHDAKQMVLDDLTANVKASVAVVARRIDKHLAPFFGARKMLSITTENVTAYVVHRQRQGIVAHKGPRKGERVSDVSNAEINREIQILKRMFSLAMRSGRIATRPHIAMLEESAPRSGFFEVEQLKSVLAHLPADVRPVIEFAHITGWRIASEVLPLKWRQVDFDAGEVRLDAGTTKNGDGRVFPMTAALRQLLKSQHVENERLKKAGQIFPKVFFREIAEGRSGERKAQPIVSFNKAWQRACREAGCPGRIPHDLRRTAVRNLVRAGIPERVAMMMTGHKTRSVFERYNIVSGGDLKSAAQMLDVAATHTGTR
jgi:integrase